jgi:alpha-tubulin suppressor-like RCC1 family protein
MGTGPLTGVTQIAAGERHTCARLNTGQLRCWGENGGGEVGDGTTVFERHRPRVVLNVAGSGPLTGVTQVDAGDSATCARLANGQARCWGVGNSGVLGTGTNNGSSLPVVVKNQGGGGPLTGVTQVAVDQSNACARLANGQARCWGFNDTGQNGNGTTTQHFLPVTVLNVAGGGPLTGVTRIDVGGGHTCARLGNGQARCWGLGDHGQLGWDALSGNLVPRVVVNIKANGPLRNVRQIRTGALHTCAVLSSGQLRCWGHNDDGQVGDGTDSIDRKRPRIVIT